MWQSVLKWSLPVQILLLVLLLVLVSQQSGSNAGGPFPSPPPAEQLIGKTRTVQQGYAIVGELRYAGVDRGSIVISEGRLAEARAHRYPLDALPREAALTTRSGQSYRFRLDAVDGAGLTITLLDVGAAAT